MILDHGFACMRKKKKKNTEQVIHVCICKPGYKWLIGIRHVEVVHFNNISLLTSSGQFTMAYDLMANISKQRCQHFKCTQDCLLWLWGKKMPGKELAVPVCLSFSEGL